MDARNLVDRSTYKLVNRETGKVEETGLKRVAAKDRQNKLWAVGTKCDLIEEIANEDDALTYFPNMSY